MNHPSYNSEKSIQAYQKRCFADYKATIGYPPSYTYLHGQSINPLVPIETPINGIMVVGAYPSAKFYNVRSDTGKVVSDVPVCDNDSPFSNESIRLHQGAKRRRSKKQNGTLRD